MNLYSMLSGNWFEELATAIPAIRATDEGKPTSKIATVARIAVAEPSDQKAANEIAQDGDAPGLGLLDAADSTASTCTARLALFTDRGLSIEHADELTDKLAGRDLHRDDRRLCIECACLSGGAGSWRCSQWRKHQHTGPEIPSDLVTEILHRCAWFNDRLGNSMSEKCKTWVKQSQCGDRVPSESKSQQE